MACVQPVQGSTARHYYVAEVDCGVTPDNPVWTPIRFTSGMPALTADFLQGQELDGSREIKTARRGSKQVGGDISVELSPGSYTDLLDAALGSTTVAGGSLPLVNIDYTQSTKTFSTVDAVDFTTILAAGNLVYMPGLADGYSGPFIVDSVATQSFVVRGIDESLVDQTGGITDVNASSSVSVGNSRKTFSILTHFPDANGGIGEYYLENGVEIVGFSFDVSVNAIVTGTFSVIGRDLIPDSGEPAGSTYNPATTTEPFAGIDGAIYQDDVQVGFVTSVAMTNDNNASAQFELGSDSVAFVERGRANNTLSLATFYTNADQVKAFTDETILKVVVSLTGPSGGMVFEYPTVKYTSGTPEIGGETSVTQSIEAQALGINGPSLTIRELVAA